MPTIGTLIGSNLGRGRGAIEPQSFYIQTITVEFGRGPGPPTSQAVFRGPLRSLPDGQVLPRLDQTWGWQYNPNLIGQDKLPVGKVIYDLPRQPTPLFQTWTSSVNIALTTVVALPFNQYDWPLTQAAKQIDRTIAASFNDNLIGQDKLPIGKVVYDLPPRGPQQPIPILVASYNLNLIGQDQLPVGENVSALPPAGPLQPIPIFTATYNKNLIGQDQLPPGKIIYERPPLAPALLQTWISATNLPLTAFAQNPFSYQYSWALPIIGPQPDRTVAVSFNLNLIGQDQLPTGKQTSDLVPRPYPEPATRTWTWWYNLNLIGQDKLTVGKQVYDLTPIAPPQTLPRSWTWSYNLNLIGQDKLPTGVQVSDLPPRAPQQPTQVFTATYNKNLIGQDQLPVGKDVTDLPPQPPLTAIQLRTWINSVNLALTVAAAQQPFNQFYWPINPGPLQPIQTFTASFNKNLIGQDKLPVGKQVYDVPPSAAQPPIPIFVASFNKNLIGQDKLPNRQQDWPNPRGYEYPINLRSSIFFPQIVPPPVVTKPFNQYDWPNPRSAGDGMDRSFYARNQFLTPFIPPPPPERPNIERPYVRDWWDSDEWGNIYPGSGIRRG